MRLPPLNGLKAFEAAARTGSYVAAARELNVSPSAISRLVKLLEGRLGVALFARRANGLTLTEAGRIYLGELTAAFSRIAEATARLQGQTRHALVIGTGPTFAMRWLIPRLPDFQAGHPETDVRLSTAIQGAEPMRPDWQAAIRLGDGNWPGLTAHFLFTAELFPVAAPSLAAALRIPSDLAHATLLQSANAPEDWRVWLRAAKVEDTVDLGRALQFDYPAFALQAALDGMGVAMARAPYVADDLKAGRLVRPFPLAVPHGRGWYFVHRAGAESDPSLTAFRDWALKAARESDSSRSPPSPSASAASAAES